LPLADRCNITTASSARHHPLFRIHHTRISRAQRNPGSISYCYGRGGRVQMTIESGSTTIVALSSSAPPLLDSSCVARQQQWQMQG
jgi:hypothetical protein